MNGYVFRFLWAAQEIVLIVLGYFIFNKLYSLLNIIQSIKII
jgi:hypothetical protein